MIRKIMAPVFKNIQAIEMKGSQHNDPYVLDSNRISTKSNHSGGIIGGISVGNKIKFQVAIKPTASIGKPQHTLNFKTKTMGTLKIEGRHDPCIVPRALPVIETVTAIVLLNQLLKIGK